MYYWGKPAPLYSYNVLLVCEAGEPWEYYKNVIVFVSSGDGQELLDLIANSSVFQCSHRSLKLEGIDSRCNLYSVTKCLFSFGEGLCGPWYNIFMPDRGKCNII